MSGAIKGSGACAYFVENIILRIARFARGPLSAVKKMNSNFASILRYWRTSLADGALGECKFTQRDRRRFVDKPSEALKSGVLPRYVVERVFRGQASARTVAVRFWPLVMASRGAARAGGLPDIVAPVVAEGAVDREGRMTPTRNALARDILTPLPSGELAIGTVDALDAFLCQRRRSRATTDNFARRRSAALEADMAA